MKRSFARPFAALFLVLLLVSPTALRAAVTVKQSSTVKSSGSAASTSADQFIDTAAFNKAKDDVTRATSRASGFFGSIGKVWDDINSWLKKTIGLSFKDVILFFATILLWVLEFVIKALEALVRVIEFVLSYIQ